MGLDYETFRQALLAERKAQLNLIDSLREAGLGEPQQEAARELSAYDQHTADQGTETFEREKDLGLLAHAKAVLERIDSALARMDEGSYGTCERCGQPIDPARLEAIPYAHRCFVCEGAEEAQYHRPVEERVLFPPFGRTFFDGEDQAAYDGEDAWQNVARHGTANSPQDVPGSLDFSDAWIDGDEQIGIVTELDALTGGYEPTDPHDDATVSDRVTEEQRSGRDRARDREEGVPKEGETL